MTSVNASLYETEALTSETEAKNETFNHEAEAKTMES